MGDVINLRSRRKQAERQAARQQADANAVKFGRSKAQKQREAQDAARMKAELDGKKRTDPD